MAKNLLTESEFKKFMKLARLEPLSSNKLSEMYGSGRPGVRDEENEEDEGLEEELSSLFEEEDEMKMDMDMEAGGEEDEDMPPVEDEEMPDVELDDEEGMGDDEGMEGGADNSEIESALTNLLDLIDQKLEAAGAGEMMDVETEDEPEGDEGMGGIEGGDADMDAAPPAPEDEEELMETVLRRVARRLQRESKVDRQSTMIAERVMKRLMKR